MAPYVSLFNNLPNVQKFPIFFLRSEPFHLSNLLLSIFITSARWIDSQGRWRKLLLAKVIGEAQGSKDALKSFLGDIGRGPKYAHVVKVEKSVLDVLEGEEGFEKRSTAWDIIFLSWGSAVCLVWRCWFCIDSGYWWSLDVLDVPWPWSRERVSSQG